MDVPLPLFLLWLWISQPWFESTSRSRYYMLGLSVAQPFSFVCERLILSSQRL
jgi:hypothetical protein